MNNIYSLNWKCLKMGIAIFNIKRIFLLITEYDIKSIKEQNMAFIITGDCIACGACQAVCPNNAVSEGDNIYIINPDLCSECVPVHETQQCAAVCPVNACIADPDRKETFEELNNKYNRMRG